MQHLGTRGTVKSYRGTLHTYNYTCIYTDYRSVEYVTQELPSNLLLIQDTTHNKCIVL